jgi:hypothetical protein
MDDVSRAHVERCLPEVGSWLRAVPDDCALVRLEDRWDEYVDGTTRRGQSADFALELGGRALGDLVTETARRLTELGAQLRSSDEDAPPEEAGSLDFGWGHLNLRLGRSNVRLWDAECAALRVASSGFAAGGASIGMSASFVALEHDLGPGRVLDRVREWLVDVEDLEAVSAEREWSSFVAADGIDERIVSRGFEASEPGTWTLDMSFSERVRLTRQRDRIQLEMERRLFPPSS